MSKKELPKDYVPKNSSMARNEEEIENLGKQMEHRRTGEVLKEEYDKVPDPIQFDKENEKE
ncbi:MULTISPECIES: hypothetical protein [unclassified Bacillus (in: firmicutes)]|uniref:hypothetical protein n=1 Tax=unclassified Bacillus (in: firmicutes) TaxID=185979 RepID=UPI001BEA051F|nr:MULTISPECIES: hypothetical protein [unclassified Bacillus (in: firmicutes)]MBT2640259.1 hypothetical protein [Bacillus sp. ISL-39]MBT2662667.1 hypothetical protein [Bacillus sp. ISL-45]